jgi:hypothetical protein
MGNDTKLVLHQARAASAPADRVVLDPNDLLTPEELAVRLKVSKSWVFEQTRERAKVRNTNKTVLPFHRMGKYLRFYWPEVSAWLLRNKD